MTPPARPPFPVNARPGSPCPTCGAWVPESTFDGCPTLTQRRREIRNVERLFGVAPWSEAEIVARIFPEWGGDGE